MGRPSVLSIAGSDPSGGAGIQADIRTLSDHGVLPLTAITCLTAQNTVGVLRSVPVDADLLTAQLEGLVADLAVDAIKIGLLGGAAQVAAVAHFLSGLPQRPPVILDPVLRASGGQSLLDADGLAILRDQLLPLATLVTPNAAEAEILAAGEVEAWAMAAPCSVLITGGDVDGDLVHDRLFGASVRTFSAPRIPDGPGVRGTGCALSSAIAALMARGQSLDQAVDGARRYVQSRIRTAVSVGAGRRVMISAR